MAELMLRKDSPALGSLKICICASWKKTTTWHERCEEEPARFLIRRSGHFVFTSQCEQSYLMVSNDW